MKKIIAILLFFVVGIFSLVSAQSIMPSGYRNLDQSAIYVYGFDGDKPLKKDTKVEVWEIRSNGIHDCLEMHQAYKGETKQVFIKRFKKAFMDKKDTKTLKSQIKMKTASMLPSFDEEIEKVPTWAFNSLIGLLIIMLLWSLFGKVDKDPRSMTRREKNKWLNDYNGKTAQIKKRARNIRKIRKARE